MKVTSLQHNTEANFYCPAGQQDGFDVTLSCERKLSLDGNQRVRVKRPHVTERGPFFYNLSWMCGSLAV